MRPAAALQVRVRVTDDQKGAIFPDLHPNEPAAVCEGVQVAVVTSDIDRSFGPSSNAIEQLLVITSIVANTATLVMFVDWLAARLEERDVQSITINRTTIEEISPENIRRVIAEEVRVRTDDQRL